MSRNLAGGEKKAGFFFAPSTGSIIEAIVPKRIVESTPPLKNFSTSAEGQKTFHEKFVIQADDEERIAHYKSIIREEFAKKNSVMFCLPTIHDSKKILDTLPKGIEDFTYVVHGGLSKKELLKTWAKAASVPHPILIVGTATALALPRRDIGAIVVERENSSAYKLPFRPYLDIRTVTEFLTETLNCKLIMGDMLLRTETLHRRERGELHELTALKFRSLTSAEQSLVDMTKTSLNNETQKNKFHIISPELETLVRGTKERSEHAFLFCSRKGLAPLTICADCGTTVLCKNCSAPLVLHSGKTGSVAGTDEDVSAGNFFFCHRCGERRSAEETCVTCHGWRLTTLGIGIEQVEKELTLRFPHLHILRIDKTEVRTVTQGIKKIKTFYNSPGSVLLGTELALLYLNEKIENTAVVSIDSLFSIPDYRISEKIMSLIIRIRSLATQQFVLQTRQKEQKIFNFALAGNLLDFYRTEIEERTAFAYPPFSMFIKITVKGEKERTKKEMEWLKEYLAPHTLFVFPAFIELEKGKHILHGLLKLPRQEWVHQELLEKILTLPPYFAVRVDPESLL